MFLCANQFGPVRRSLFLKVRGAALEEFMRSLNGKIAAQCLDVGMRDCRTSGRIEIHDNCVVLYVGTPVMQSAKVFYASGEPVREHNGVKFIQSDFVQTRGDYDRIVIAVRK
jgi:hypothetical protein